MDSNKKNARLAGVWYVFFILTFIYSLGYVPGRFLIEGDALETIKKIQEAEPLFRLGILIGMVACVVYLFLLASLYKLLSPVNKYVALMMVVFGASHLPLFFTGHVDELNLLTLLNRSHYGAIGNTDQLHTQVELLVDAYKNSVRVNTIFMGLWLLPFGYLIFKSQYLPKVLGILLILNGLPYLVGFGRDILDPTYTFPTAFSYFFRAVANGEFVACLWLLIMGAKESAPQPAKTVA
jgi:hypothetical protein